MCPLTAATSVVTVRKISGAHRMSISTEELSKALVSLSEALNLYVTTSDPVAQKAFRDACIQRFEYSVELAWKTSIKLLGSNIRAAKPAVREMARNNLIDNPGDWLVFIDARNDSSHSYDEEVALRVFAQVQNFLPCGLKLMKVLEGLPK